MGAGTTKGLTAYVAATGDVVVVVGADVGVIRVLISVNSKQISSKEGRSSIKMR